MVKKIKNNSEIKINVVTQKLRLENTGGVIFETSISTAKNGVGELYGSECTPRGCHIIRAKIGSGQADNAVFIGRRSTGEFYTQDLRQQYPDRDWILTRIMWLSGLEKNKNRLGKVDTMRRYIYIHGCPDDDVMGIPSSHGCIKMRNKDVVALFDMVNVGTLVTIEN